MSPPPVTVADWAVVVGPSDVTVASRTSFGCVVVSPSTVTAPVPSAETWPSGAGAPSGGGGGGKEVLTRTATTCDVPVRSDASVVRAATQWTPSETVVLSQVAV